MKQTLPTRRFSWMAVIMLIVGVIVESILRICRFRQWLARKLNKPFDKIDNVTTVVVIAFSLFFTFLIMLFINAYWNIDLFIDGAENDNRGTYIYHIFWDIIPVFLLAVLLFFCRIFRYGFPKNGTWYCEKHQSQICFDSINESFITKEQKRILCKSTIRKGSKYIYLFSLDPTEDCLLSGHLLCSRKNIIYIQMRTNGHPIYKFKKQKEISD